MTTLTQTLTLTYPQDAQLDLNTGVYSLCTGLMINGSVWGMSFGIVLEEYPVLRDLGDVRGKWSDTVPEWQKINLVTLLRDVLCVGVPQDLVLGPLLCKAYYTIRYIRPSITVWGARASPSLAITEYHQYFATYGRVHY